MIHRFLLGMGIALTTFWSASGARANECTTVKDCAAQMVALANQLKDENAELLKRVDALEKLAPKWNGSADDLVALKKALSEPATVREVDVPFKQPGKCQPGEVMVGWRIYGTPDMETVHSKIQCARVFGERP